MRGGRREMPFNLSRIGQLLRETREKRGLTCDDVSEALFIKKRVIGAIEAGDWNGLPHPVYVKGYVTQYAAFLSVLDLLEKEVASREDESLLQGPGKSTRKEGILRGWKIRKKLAQTSHPLNAPWSVIDQM
jgi:cytoskeleton protein RodZ